MILRLSKRSRRRGTAIVTRISTYCLYTWERFLLRTKNGIAIARKTPSTSFFLYIFIIWDHSYKMVIYIWLVPVRSLCNWQKEKFSKTSPFVFLIALKPSCQVWWWRGGKNQNPISNNVTGSNYIIIFRLKARISNKYLPWVDLFNGLFRNFFCIYYQAEVSILEVYLIVERIVVELYV